VTILLVATLTKFVVSDPFQITESPAISAKAVFHPLTAQGKLKAEMMPTFPIGFHYSIIIWPGRSLGMTLPPIVRERPTAISHMSIYSYTSPSPSDLILPISSDIREPRADLCFLKD